MGGGQTRVESGFLPLQEQEGGRGPSAPRPTLGSCLRRNKREEDAHPRRAPHWVPAFAGTRGGTAARSFSFAAVRVTCGGGQAQERLVSNQPLRGNVVGDGILDSGFRRNDGWKGQV